MEPSTKLLLVRLLHTAVWAVMAGAILALPFAASARRFRVTFAITALIAFEGVALGSAGGACPLTGVAARYSEVRGPAFDIFLPELLAKWNKTLFSALFALGQLAVIVQLVRSGDRALLRRHVVLLLLGGGAAASSYVGFMALHMGELGIRPAEPGFFVWVALGLALLIAGIAVWRAAGRSATPWR